MRAATRLRCAAGLIAVGLAFELLAVMHLTPATFVALALVGVPMVSIGVWWAGTTLRKHRVTPASQVETHRAALES